MYYDPLLPPRDLQDCQSLYLDIHRTMTGAVDAEKENINEDVVFELELIRQVDINIDAILPPVRRFGGGRAEKKRTVIGKLKVFFEKFMGLIGA